MENLEVRFSENLIFKQLALTKVKESTNKKSNHGIVVSNKYGYVFILTINGFYVYKSEDLINMQPSFPKNLNDAKYINVPFAYGVGDHVLISLNSTEEFLTIIFDKTIVIFSLADINHTVVSAFDSEITKLDINPIYYGDNFIDGHNETIKDFGWNTSLTDYSDTLYLITSQQRLYAMHFASLNINSKLKLNSTHYRIENLVFGACWSPKGKQLLTLNVTSSLNGIQLTQHRLQMDPHKNLDMNISLNPVKSHTLQWNNSDLFTISRCLQILWYCNTQVLACLQFDNEEIAFCDIYLDKNVTQSWIKIYTDIFFESPPSVVNHESTNIFIKEVWIQYLPCPANYFENNNDKSDSFPDSFENYIFIACSNYDPYVMVLSRLNDPQKTLVVLELEDTCRAKLELVTIDDDMNSDINNINSDSAGGFEIESFPISMAMDYSHGSLSVLFPRNVRYDPSPILYLLSDAGYIAPFSIVFPAKTNNPDNKTISKVENNSTFSFTTMEQIQNNRTQLLSQYNKYEHILPKNEETKNIEKPLEIKANNTVNNNIPRSFDKVLHNQTFLNTEIQTEKASGDNCIANPKDFFNSEKQLFTKPISTTLISSKLDGTLDVTIKDTAILDFMNQFGNQIDELKSKIKSKVDEKFENDTTLKMSMVRKSWPVKKLHIMEDTNKFARVLQYLKSSIKAISLSIENRATLPLLDTLSILSYMEHELALLQKVQQHSELPSSKIIADKKNSIFSTPNNLLYYKKHSITNQAKTLGMINSQDYWKTYVEKYFDRIKALKQEILHVRKLIEDNIQTYMTDESDIQTSKNTAQNFQYAFTILRNQAQLIRHLMAEITKLELLHKENPTLFSRLRSIEFENNDSLKSPPTQLDDKKSLQIAQKLLLDPISKMVYLTFENNQNNLPIIQNIDFTHSTHYPHDDYDGLIQKSIMHENQSFGHIIKNQKEIIAKSKHLSNNLNKVLNIDSTMKSIIPKPSFFKPTSNIIETIVTAKSTSTPYVSITNDTNCVTLSAFGDNKNIDINKSENSVPINSSNYHISTQNSFTDSGKTSKNNNILENITNQKTNISDLKHENVLDNIKLTISLPPQISDNKEIIGYSTNITSFNNSFLTLQSQSSTTTIANDISTDKTSSTMIKDTVITTPLNTSISNNFNNDSTQNLSFDLGFCKTAIHTSILPNNSIQNSLFPVPEKSNLNITPVKITPSSLEYSSQSTQQNVSSDNLINFSFTPMINKENASLEKPQENINKTPSFSTIQSNSVAPFISTQSSANLFGAGSTGFANFGATLSLGSTQTTTSSHLSENFVTTSHNIFSLNLTSKTCTVTSTSNILDSTCSLPNTNINPIFGSAANFNVFGNSPSTSSNLLFGNVSMPSQKSSNIFGTSQQNIASFSLTSPQFGTAPVFGGSAFGNQAIQNVSSQNNVFGGFATFSSPFGVNASVPNQSTSNLFGNILAQQSQGFGFGQPANITANPIFGSSSLATTHIFGQPVSQGQNVGFTNQSTGFSGFGLVSGTSSFGQIAGQSPLAQQNQPQNFGNTPPMKESFLKFR